MSEKEKIGAKRTLVFGIVLAVIGFAFGSCIFYNIGRAKGETEVREELGKDVQRMGELVMEKSKVVEIGRDALEFSGEDLSNTELEALDKALKNAESVATVAEAREVIINLLQRTEEFQFLYQGGDGVAIAQEYESLKDAFREGEKKLNEIYNSEISSSFNSSFDKS